MKYKIEISAEGDSEILYNCFLSEASDKDRASIKITREKNSVRFKIEAKDATALKASANSIIKLLEVHEKLKDVK